MNGPKIATAVHVTPRKVFSSGMIPYTAFFVVVIWALYRYMSRTRSCGFTSRAMSTSYASYPVYYTFLNYHLFTVLFLAMNCDILQEPKEGLPTNLSVPFDSHFSFKIQLSLSTSVIAFRVSITSTAIVSWNWKSTICCLCLLLSSGDLVKPPSELVGVQYFPFTPVLHIR